MPEQSKVVAMLNRISDRMEKILNIFIGIFVGALGISVFTGVIGRNVNIPVVWLDEVSTYSCIWATFFGFAVASKHGMLSNVDAFIHKVSKKKREYFEIFWNVFGCIFMGIVLWSAKDYILYAFWAETVSPQMRVPLGFVYMGPVIGYLFAVFFGIVNIVNQVVSLKADGRNR